MDILFWRKIAVAAIVFILLAALGVWAYSIRSAPKYQFQSDLRSIETVMRRDGVSAALTYVDEDIFPKAGYATTHMYLHTVGDYAYAEEQDLQKALDYLKPFEASSSSSQKAMPFDGYIHGVLSTYFSEATSTAYPSLMTKVCGNTIVIPTIRGDVFACYHALGHALVHASGNHVRPALLACDTAKTKDMRDGCYLGAFMEISYLFSPEYHKGALRPDSEGDSMIPLCEQFAAPISTQCAYFVGQSYLLSHGLFTDGKLNEKLQDAFNECERLFGNELKNTCANRLGYIYIPRLAATEDGAKQMCKKYSGNLYGPCFAGAQKAIGLGYAPDALDNESFN